VTNTTKWTQRRAGRTGERGRRRSRS
jgi:hypothetical protein